MSVDRPRDGARRGRPRAQSDPERRVRILDAAMRVFIEKGFARATMADIAGRAGMSKRDLYLLFSDKAALLTSVILSRRHLILDLPRPPGETGSPLEILCRIFRLGLQDPAAAERDALLNLIARESLLVPELNALLYDTGTIRWREFLVAWLEERMEAGDLPRCDSAQLAGMLMDTVFGALLPRRRKPGGPDRQAQARDIARRISILLAGVESLAAPR